MKGSLSYLYLRLVVLFLIGLVVTMILVAKAAKLDQIYRGSSDSLEEEAPAAP